jgi:hypothetical protein
MIQANDLMQLLILGYPSETGEKLGSVVANLYSVGYLKPDYYGWHQIRQSMGKTEFRTMLVKLMEESFDRLNQIPKLLKVVYEDESDDFDIAETLRHVLETNWIMDIIPSSRKAARRALEDHIVSVFPFAKKVVDDFVSEALRLEPLVVEQQTPTKKEQSDKSILGSSDSEIESAGSLNEFVVDEEEEEGESDGGSTSGSSSSTYSSGSSLESSNYSDATPEKKKRKKMPSNDSSSSSSGYSS